MANKYYNGTSDLSNLWEERITWSGTNYLAAPFKNSFLGDVEYTQAGTDTVNLTLDNFKIGTTSCTAVKKGYLPTDSWFHTVYSAGDYTITRTSTSLKIGSTTFNTSNFRGGIIPSEIIVVIAGGGGGGGGFGYYSPGKDKSGFVKVPGGAGGGGGIILGRIRLDTWPTTYLTVGKGGAAGSDGSSSSASKGSTGTNGSASYLSGDTGDESVVLLYAGGGYGGKGGDGTADTASGGTGGNGGSGSSPDGYIASAKYATVKGGKGNYHGSHTNTKCAGISFTPTKGTGAAASTFVGERNLNGTSANYNQDNDSSSFYSGGCSAGYGAYWLVAGTTLCAADCGGGGGGGTLKSAGGAGYARFYY